jgi:probable rRNA maturation factor
MNLTVDIQVACEDEDQPPPTSIKTWLSAALSTALNRACAEQTTPAFEVSVRIVNSIEITQLNHQYRGKNKATNVLSFPADLPEYIEPRLLGDLIICASVVAQEAEQQHKPLHAHWAHIVVHGTLHLLGYDHINDADANQMEALEIDILSALNVTNPYIDSQQLDPTTTHS